MPARIGRRIAFVAVMLLAPLPSEAQQQLLPIYGVDLPLDDALEKTWARIAPLGFGAIRFDVDVRDPAAVDAVARACVWAAGKNVKIVPVLAGAKPGEATPAAFASQAAGFVIALSQTLRGGTPEQAAAYQQILAFQIGRAMNDASRHGGMPRETALLRLLQAARAIRKAEEPLAAAGIAATPIMIEASFDAEVKATSLDANGEFSDAVYTSALAPLAAFVGEAAASTDLDLIAVEYLAGSESPGDVSYLARLAGDLAAPAAGRKIVVVTGMPEGGAFANDQRRFYALAFANLADYRASQGVDSALAGVVFRWATEDPAREALTKVAESVTAAEAETPAGEQPADPAPVADPASGDSALASAAKDKVQQFLLGLLDRSLEKLGSGMLTTGDAVPPEPALPVDAPSAPPEPPKLVFDGPPAATGKAVAGSAVQIDALIHNKSSVAAAEGLTAVLVDETGAVLNADTMAADLLIEPSSNRTLHVTWTPPAAGVKKIAIVVADASLGELAKSAYVSLNVSPAAKELPPTETLHTQIGFPTVAQIKPGAASQIAVTLKNPYRTPLKAMTVTLAVAGAKPAPKTISYLAPEQSRTLTFAASPARQGPADVQITLTMGGKSAVVTSRMSAVALVPAVMPPASSRAPVRSPLIARAPSPPVSLRAPASSPAPAPSRTMPPPPPRVALPPARAQQPAQPPARVVRPDIAIIDAGYTAQQTRTGQVITVKVTLRNLGDGVAQGMRLSCGAGSRGASRMLAGVLGPGQTRSVSCQVAIPAGTPAAQIGVAISAAGDTNAGNNQRVLSIQAGRRR